MKLKDPLLGLKIKFPKGNKFQFFMDMWFHLNIPSNVEFIIKEDASHNSYWLVAKGYGHSKDYGNGSISVNKDDIMKVLAEFYRKHI